MSKEQTPIERFEAELRHTYDNKLKNDHILKAFKVLSNQMVLETLEKYEDKILQVVEKKADVKDYILQNRSKTKVQS